MGVFKHQSKGRNIYYAGFGVRGQYFVRSLGTSNQREAERKEKKLRALAEAGRLPLKVSEDDRVKAIRKSLAIPIVSRIHRASARAAAKKRKKSPEKRKAWIAAIKAGQDVPEVKALMVKANQKTAANPISKKRKRRSLKKMWKRRGHKSRVSEGVRKANATDEVKERRRVGRERWAKKLLGIDVTANAPSGGAKKPRDRGRPEGITPLTGRRLRHLAAIQKLGRSLRGSCALVYPDAPASAESSSYALRSKHLSEINRQAETLTSSEAEALLRAPVKLA